MALRCIAMRGNNLPQLLRIADEIMKGDTHTVTAVNPFICPAVDEDDTIVKTSDTEFEMTTFMDNRRGDVEWTIIMNVDATITAV